VVAPGDVACKEVPRRSFAEDYKRQAAELVVSSGRSITSAAQKLGLRDSAVLRGEVAVLSANK